MNPDVNVPQDRSDAGIPPLSLLSTEERLNALESGLNKLREETPDANKITLLFFSGEQDKVMAGTDDCSDCRIHGSGCDGIFYVLGYQCFKGEASLLRKRSQRKDDRPDDTGRCQSYGCVTAEHARYGTNDVETDDEGKEYRFG